MFNRSLKSEFMRIPSELDFCPLEGRFFASAC
jgi:hypothetical protein